MVLERRGKGKCRGGGKGGHVEFNKDIHTRKTNPPFSLTQGGGKFQLPQRSEKVQKKESRGEKGTDDVWPPTSQRKEERETTTIGGEGKKKRGKETT